MMNIENFIKKLFFLQRFYKVIFFICFDFLMSTFSLWISFCLRLGEFYHPLKIDIILYLCLFLLFNTIQIYFKSYYQLSRFFSIASINNLLRNFFLLFIFTYFARLIFFKNIFFPSLLL